MRNINLKIPNFKFPKIKMKGIENIPEVNIDYNGLKDGTVKKDKKQYKPTEYKTIKEIFERSTDIYANKEFFLEKFNPKGEFEYISYKQFKEDVVGLGTGLTKKFNLNNNERIVVIGENTYQWYVSYMAALCGAGIAVPVDKELPANELENVINRSKATIIIYSPKKKDVIKKVQDNLPGVKYFAQMYNIRM